MLSTLLNKMTKCWAGSAQILHIHSGTAVLSSHCEDLLLGTSLHSQEAQKNQVDRPQTFPVVHKKPQRMLLSHCQRDLDTTKLHCYKFNLGYWTCPVVQICLYMGFKYLSPQSRPYNVSLQSTWLPWQVFAYFTENVKTAAILTSTEFSEGSVQY